MELMPSAASKIIKSCPDEFETYLLDYRERFYFELTVGMKGWLKNILNNDSRKCSRFQNPTNGHCDICVTENFFK